MADIVLSLLIIPLLGCFFSLSAKKNDDNAFYVAVFTLLSNVLVVLWLISKAAVLQTGLLYKFQWFNKDNMDMTLGFDVLSLLLLLGIYLSVFIGLVGLNQVQRKSKLLILLSLYFIWDISGFILAKDIISFYLFFAGMLLPVFILLGAFGNVKKTAMLYLFFIVNFAGILCLLVAMVFVYKFYHGSVLLQDIVITDMPSRVGICVCLSAGAAFATRVPIWPFHYWISLISASIKNPVAHIITNMLPLTGVWGVMCFWSSVVPEEVKMLSPWIVSFGLLTMLFIAFIGLAHNDFILKLFSYSTIYFIFFLLAIVVLHDKYRTAMVYSLFIFMIVHASLVALDLIVAQACGERHGGYHGVLGYMPKVSRLFTFFVFIAAGLPISSMFWNNFVLISAIFRRNFAVGFWCISAIALIGMALLHELYVMYEKRSITVEKGIIEDISDRRQAVFMMIIIILFLSFFKPLWFVF